VIFPSVVGGGRRYHRRGVLRSLRRVFRDERELSADPAVWPSIQAALDGFTAEQHRVIFDI
jgi:hypothetical protein